MKFSIQGYVFREMLATASKAVAGKPVIPILDCIRFDVSDGKLALTASDTAVIIRCTRALAREETGAALPFCVPAKELAGTLRGLSSELSFDTDCESRVAVSWNGGEVCLPALTTTDWPDYPGAGKGAFAATLPAAAAGNAIGLVSYAAAKDGIREAMTGIRLELLGDRMEAVASDAHILAVAGVPGAEARRAFGVTLPAKALQGFGKMFTEPYVSLRAGKQWAEFSTTQDMLAIRLIEEAYPNYRAVIPQGHAAEATFVRADLLAVLARIGACGSLSRLLRLSFTDGSAVLSAQDTARGVTGEESVPCEMDGGGLDVGFNADRLEAVLGKLPADRVTFLLAGPSTAAVIRPEDFDAEKENVMALVVPMSLGGPA